MYKYAAVILSLAIDNIQKKRRNLYLLPSYVSRLLALPFRCRTATQKPTFIFNIQTSANICKQLSYLPIHYRIIGFGTCLLL